jgi:putative CocE/NonD family hydrolase
MSAGGAALLVVLLAGVAAPSAAGDQPTGLPYRIDRCVRIPMRDGVMLGAVQYHPAGADTPLPVIATMTPYTADRFHDIGSYFARHGYIFVIVDSRGRGDSGGEFVPWMSEARDLHDALEWLATRKYANGQTATWGGSYAGKNQWGAAGLQPRSLRTIVPASAGFVGFDMGMRRNIPFSYMQRWLTLISGKAANREHFADLEYWIAAYFELSRGDVSWRDFDALTGNPSPIWQQWADHPQFDGFWDAASPTDEQFAGIRIPVLSITGLYDDAQLGSLEFRRRHLQQVPAAAWLRDYTIVGPWDHAGTRDPRANLGGLDFGPDSVLDIKKLHLEWYDWILRDGKRPTVLQDRFVYFVTGSNRWAHAADLDAATGRMEVLHLSSLRKSGGSISERGQLVNDAESQEHDTYVYDPSLPAHNEGVEGEDAVSDSFLIDDRSVSRLRGDGLVYDSDVYAEGIEVVGRPWVRLYVSMDVPDTDIRVQLFEVRKDGVSVFLAQDLMRARYRQTARQATLVTPGRLDVYLFDQFPFVARTLATGSRLRLVISPVGASIHQQRNRNSGGVVADETARDNRVAHISVALGPQLSSVAIPHGR